MAKLIVLFCIYSFLGWLWESFYCIIKEGKWESRGFLFGPICPIYGFGAIIASFAIRNINFLDMQSKYYNIKIFFFACIGTALMEYVTSFVLEKCFHAVWWDYSKVPLNINGRISLPTTFGFGLAGVILPKILIFPIEDRVNLFSNNFYDPIAFFIIGLIGADIALTISTLTDLNKRVVEFDAKFNEKMSNTVDIVKEKGVIIKEKVIDSNIERFLNSKDFLYKNTLQRVKYFKIKNKDKQGILDKIKNFSKK